MHHCCLNCIIFIRKVIQAQDMQFPRHKKVNDERSVSRPSFGNPPSFLEETTVNFSSLPFQG